MKMPRAAFLPLATQSIQLTVYSRVAVLLRKREKLIQSMKLRRLVFHFARDDRLQLDLGPVDQSRQPQS